MKLDIFDNLMKENSVDTIINGKRYKGVKEKDRTLELQYLLNIGLQDKLSQDKRIENLTDYSLELASMGESRKDRLYKVRLNKCWTQCWPIRDEQDMKNIIIVMYSHIFVLNRDWKEKE